MPNANDAELTELYTAATGLDVEDTEPNTGPPGTPPAADYDLHVEGDYTIVLTCIDETLAAPNAGMSRTVNQEFKQADGWEPGGAAGNFHKEEKFTIAVPANVRGHVFRYVGTLLSDNNEVVSFIESNRFVLV